MLSPKARRNLIKILPFSLIWGVFGLLFVLIERGLMGTTVIYPATQNPYSFINSLLYVPTVSLIGGTIMGSVEVVVLKKQFAGRPLAVKLLLKTLVYFVAIVLFLSLTSLVLNSAAYDLFGADLWQSYLNFITNFAFWSVAIYIGALVGVSLLLHEVSDNLGQGVLYNFFTGKYYRPVQEQRIFMFLDMKGSTTIAEQLGHVRYFSLLQQYYAHLSDAILNYEGEIYQYVGDEVVVSWPMKNGLYNYNCLRCFQAMAADLAAKAPAYQQQFGVVPTFKAGLHCGQVTTGEVGVLKREIAFSGDVLNTTARIQSLCNSYGVRLLVSADLQRLLPPTAAFTLKPMGEAELRGRQQKIELFTLN